MNTLTWVRFETSRKNLRRNLEAATVIVDFEPIDNLFGVAGGIHHAAWNHNAKAADVEPAHTLSNSFDAAEVNHTLQEGFLHAALSDAAYNRVEVLLVG